MYTQTIIPDSPSITIQLPDSYVGQEVRLIAIVEKKEIKSTDISDKVKNIKKKYAVYPRINLADFTFNRDDANDFS